MSIMVRKTKSMTSKILETIPSGSVVVELGAGRGTADLVDHFEVWAIEHDPRYVGVISGVNYIYAPLVPITRQHKKFVELTEWYDSSIIQAKLPKQHKAIIVDGPPTSARRGGFYVNYELFDPTAIVFIDDVGRSHEMQMLRWFTRDLKIPEVTIRDSHQRHMWSMFDPKDSIR